MKVCPKCGSIVDKDDLFCLNCGARLTQDESAQEAPKQLHCTNCGAAISPIDRYCPQCGMANENYDPFAQTSGAEKQDTNEVPHEEEAPKRNILYTYPLYWKNTFNYTGRSNRAEYWFPFLINWIIDFFISLLNTAFSKVTWFAYTYTLYPNTIYATSYTFSWLNLISLGIMIAQISCVVRRLRDAGKSPFSIFYAMIPFAGPIMVLVWLLQPTGRYHD